MVTNLFSLADHRRKTRFFSSNFAKAWTTFAAITCGANVEAVEVRYALWDSNQLPAYKQCAETFQAQNPTITIKFSQLGWGDYWTAISTGVIAGSAPDVFTNHLAKYPEFVKNQQLVDLTPYMQRDKTDASIYTPGLFNLWSRDGKHYGLPKDWDTIGLVVNMAHAKKRGVSLDELNAMTWNPTDGGTFEKVVRKLSVDANGNGGDAPNFAKNRTKIYGYQNPGPGGMMGQTEWSHFAASTGWTFQTAPWSPALNYADAQLAQTLDYLASLPEKGLSARYELTRSLGNGALFLGRRVAMIPEGSWMVGHFAKNAKFEHAWVPLPVGPSGKRATILNGLADSIWAGSKVKEEAWAWVKFLGSQPCQHIVAKQGVVFPAVRGEEKIAMDVMKSRGSDTTAFLTMTQGRTFPPPIIDKSAEINDIVGNAMESILIGRSRARDALQSADVKVRTLLSKSR